MRMKKYLCRLAGTVCAIAIVSCVDSTFSVDDLSTEVTLVEGTTTVPLGYLNKQTLGDIIGDIEAQGLECDDNGNYVLNYEGEGETIEIEGITTNFSVPSTMTSFSLECPSFDIGMNAVVIQEEATVNISDEILDALTSLQGVGNNNADYYLPDSDLYELPVIKGTYHKEFTEENMSLHCDVPAEVQDIVRILFRNIESGHNGAPMHLTFNLNDFVDINGGGSLKFNLKIEGGNFRILSSTNELLYEGNNYGDIYDIGQGHEQLDFVVYIESIENTTGLNSEHQLDIPLRLTYDMEFEINTCPGSFSLDEMPSIELNAQFEYGDADIILDSDVNIVEYEPEEPSLISIKGMPDLIKGINRVSLADDSHLTLFAHGIDWLGDDNADALVAQIRLPDYLLLHALPGAGYEYDEQEHLITASITDLDSGVEVIIEAIDFGTSGISPEAGEIVLEFKPQINVHFKEDMELLISSIMPDKSSVTVETGIDAAELSILSVTGAVDYSYEVDEMFKLTGLEDMDVEINGIGLKPVIIVDVKNPLTISASLDGVITPSLEGGEVLEDNKLEVHNVVLPAAQYVDGVIVPAEVSLVIADETLREQYAGDEYIFVACDVTKLVVGNIPDYITINLRFGVDPDVVQTIYVDEAFEVSYDYRVTMPLDVTNVLDISYDDVITGLNSTFSQLAQYDIKVGDVAVIAEIHSTLPLALYADVEMLDKDGVATTAQVRLPEGSFIDGSVDGVTESVSTVRFELKLDEGGSVGSLADVDGLNFHLNAKGAAESSAPLNANQYISAELKLEVRGGITIDLATLK